MFNALDRLQYLQMLDLSDAAGLRAPLFDPTVDQRDSGICLLASRLSVLNMAEIGESFSLLQRRKSVTTPCRGLAR